MTMIGQFIAGWQLHLVLLNYFPMTRKEDCALLKAWELFSSHPLDRTGPELQLPKSTEKRQSGVGLIQWETKMISLECLELGKSRKKIKLLMNISAVNNKHCEILQNRKPMGLEKVGAGKRGMES
jgi:hypothetical protein